MHKALRSVASIYMHLFVHCVCSCMTIQYLHFVLMTVSWDLCFLPFFFFFCHKITLRAVVITLHGLGNMRNCRGTGRGGVKGYMQFGNNIHNCPRRHYINSSVLLERMCQSSFLLLISNGDRNKFLKKLSVRILWVPHGDVFSRVNPSSEQSSPNQNFYAVLYSTVYFKRKNYASVFLENLVNIFPWR